MITYRIANPIVDLGFLQDIRLEMLKEVNNLPADYQFDEILVRSSEQYFCNGDQTTVLAFDRNDIIGCASISYISIMPTFSHPTGKRAHLMNVYTKENYRGQHVARTMVEMLIRDAQDHMATEISLDATQAGRALYSSLGFQDSVECMVLNL